VIIIFSSLVLTVRKIGRLIYDEKIRGKMEVSNLQGQIYYLFTSNAIILIVTLKKIPSFFFFLSFYLVVVTVINR